MARSISDSPARRISISYSPLRWARSWSTATMLLVSASATMNLCWARSSATGNMRLRRAMSRGSCLSAAGSTMMRDRSTDCSPSFSDSASRSVASETKPSCTSSLPTGICCLVCSSSAMRSWSSVRIPWSIRIWPRWRLACGGAGWFIGRS
jgi:hypothetical protein